MKVVIQKIYLNYWKSLIHKEIVMPTYIYFCGDGHNEFEEYHSMSDEAKLKECPHCRKEKDISTPVKRLINSMTKGVVELTGQEYTDKVKQDAAAYKKEVYRSELLYSNVLGDNNYSKVQQKLDRQRGR